MFVLNLFICMFHSNKVEKRHSPKIVYENYERKKKNQKKNCNKMGVFDVQDFMFLFVHMQQRVQNVCLF